MNLILIGYRGSGKTTIGKIIAEKLKREFVDCDEYIETTSNLSIREIFEICGEPHFRRLESEAIDQLSKRNGLVLATGGGAVLRYRNVRQLKSNGVVVFLDVDAETAFERISKDASRGVVRPALTGHDMRTEIREQVAHRRPYYLRAADFVVSAAGRTAELIADEIVSSSGERLGPVEEV